jgi:phage shock protein A
MTMLSNQEPMQENDILRMNVNDLEQQLHKAYQRIRDLNQQLEQVKNKKKFKQVSTINS